MAFVFEFLFFYVEVDGYTQGAEIQLQYQKECSGTKQYEDLILNEDRITAIV